MKYVNAVRRMHPLIGFVLIAATGTACSAPSAESRHAASGMMPAQLEAKAERLVVKSGTLNVTVDDVEATVGKVGTLAQEAGGYVETSVANDQKSARLVVRVPRAKLEPLMDTVAGLGTEEFRSIAGEDVTEQYVDIEIRLKNAMALRDRLRALLPKATKVDEILQIEKELARVQGDVEVLQSRLDRLRNRLELSALTVNLERRQVLGPLGYLAYGIWWAIKKLFVLN